MFSYLVRTLAVLGAAAVPSICGAAPVVNVFSQTTAFAVSDSDLLNGIDPSRISISSGGLLNPGSPDAGMSQDITTLTNGQFGVLGQPQGSGDEWLADAVAFGNGATLTYTLDLTNAPMGYHLTEIHTYTGWRDGGRDRQDYIVYYSTVDDPDAFQLLATVANLDGSGSSPTNVMVEIFDDQGGFLAENVAAIRFVFDAQENGWVGYRELDVFGVNAIPEPSSIALWSVMGAAGLAWQAGRRWRKTSRMPQGRSQAT